jgi:hypothetical protein
VDMKGVGALAAVEHPIDIFLRVTAWAMTRYGTSSRVKQERSERIFGSYSNERQEGGGVKGDESEKVEPISPILTIYSRPFANPLELDSSIPPRPALSSLP